MKILFVGDTHRTSLSLHYFTNLVRLGYLVLPYNPFYFYTRHIFEKFSVKLKKEPSDHRKKQVSCDLITLCRKNCFDVVLIMAENFIDSDTLQEMKGASATPPLLVFHSHDNTFSPGILKPAYFINALLAYDFVFTTKSYNVNRYRALGQQNSFFIPSAYEPTLHHPISNQYSIYQNKAFDVTFIGTYDLSRIRYLDAVGWERLYVWGDHWGTTKAYRHHPSRIHPKAIYDFEFADVTSRTKCALGLLREEAQDLHTTRTFEIPACGTMQLAPRNNEILSFFEEDKEIVCFDSKEELKDKVDYYLANDWSRIAIARHGFERCTRDHNTYLDRIKEMFKTIRTKGHLSVQKVHYRSN